LFASLARAAERLMDDFKKDELSNIAWSFATVGRLDGPLFAVLAREAQQRID